MPPHSQQLAKAINGEEDHEEPLALEISKSSSKIHERHCNTTFLLHPTYTLPLLVMIDMFSVSLVVPLLMRYYTTAGVTSASQRELLSSLFSASQIVGGLLLGGLADAGLLQRRSILILSFGGSAFAYALIVRGNIAALVMSRILVGLVKQTMTVCTTLLTDYTTMENRALHMGRLNASSTVAWILGPSVGALLYKTVDFRAPALLAVALFIVNMILTLILLPCQGNEVRSLKDKTRSNNFSSFSLNLKECFASPLLRCAILSMLLFSWVTRATSYNSMASYYEELFGIETHHRGYLSSYQQCLSFLVQSVLVGPMISWTGGEHRAATYAALMLAMVTLLETNGNLHLFLLIVAPMVSLSVSVMSLSLSSLITHVTPKESLGSVFAALDVLQNASAVTVPFYRTILFSMLGGDMHGSMRGDPEPKRWILSSSAHWFAAAAAMWVLLLRKPIASTTSSRKTM